MLETNKEKPVSERPSMGKLPKARLGGDEAGVAGKV